MKTVTFGLEETDVNGEVRTKEVTANGNRIGVSIYTYDSNSRITVVNSGEMNLKTVYLTPDDFWADIRKLFGKKPKRIFLWTFLSVQAIFLLWIVVGVIGNSHGAPSADVHKVCDNGGWRVLFTSHADCMTHYAHALTQAGEAGTAIGVGLIIALWVAVDIILGVGRLVVVTSRRRK